MSDKCLACGKEVPADMLQQPVLDGTLHIDCGYELITVYQVEIKDVGMGPISDTLDGPINELKNHFESGQDETMLISTKKMTRTEYHSLPEFGGY